MGRNMVISVVSFPPCGVEVLVKAAPTLPKSLPSAHITPVLSKSFFMAAVMLPYRLGEPKTTASARTRSSSVTWGTALNRSCAFRQSSQRVGESAHRKSRELRPPPCVLHLKGKEDSG